MAPVIHNLFFWRAQRLAAKYTYVGRTALIIETEE